MHPALAFIFFFKGKQQHGKINPLITYTTVPYHRDNKIGQKSGTGVGFHFFLLKHNSSKLYNL